MPSVPAKALDWIVSGDTGLSSEAIWATMVGAKRKWSSYPHDPADLGRCLRLLRLMPRWRKRLDEMRQHGPAWAALVEHWDDLEALMDEEVGIDWSKGDRAGMTYKRMREILDPIERQQRAA